MTKDKTLLILAGGMGSRFGGLKQIEPIDDSGNFIIDYSIYDAIKVGFNKVVFVIKEENLEIFKTTVGNRVSKYIPVEYAFQGLNDFVNNVPEGRVKPWGTAHAVLCAKNAVKGDFAMINADDFYGYDAFKTASEYIDKNSSSKEYGLIAYKVGNTLTENGAVKRGVCNEENGYLTKMTESSVEWVNGKIIASPLTYEPSFELEANHPVSMNLICFNSNFFDYLEKDFKRFLQQNEDNLLKCECLIQDVMFHQIEDEGAKTEVIPTTAVWHGVTYKEDKAEVVKAIKELALSGNYPIPLWK